MGRPSTAGLASLLTALTLVMFTVRVAPAAMLASRSSSSASAVSEGTPAVTSPFTAPPCWFSFKPWSSIIVCSPAVPKSSVGSAEPSSSSSAARSESRGTSVVIPTEPISSEVRPEVNVKFSVVGGFSASSPSSSSASAAKPAPGEFVVLGLPAKSCPGSMVTRRGRCLVRSSDCGVCACGVGAPVDSAGPGVSRVKSDWPVPGATKLRFPPPIVLPGVLFSALAPKTPGVSEDVFAASEVPPDPALGESLTPNAANGSTRPPVIAAATLPELTIFPVGVCAMDGEGMDAAGDTAGAVGGFGEGAAPLSEGAGGGQLASDAGGLGAGGTSAADGFEFNPTFIAADFSASALAAIAVRTGSGNALFSSPSSFMNSRTDSSAVSTAKETRLFMDCLRLFLAPAFIAPAPGLAILDTSLRMERRRRLRIELGVGSAFSLCSARCGVAASLPGLCATGEGTALLPFGASTEPARGERRVGIPPAISELPRALRAD
mmetsp:Transcript_10176/g.46614  ORF Transcript_10176/g.46614 Transcript_10176/m.46614 type:complete len:491 (-) Transcript_10176:177-1649(-)